MLLTVSQTVNEQPKKNCANLQCLNNILKGIFF